VAWAVRLVKTGTDGEEQRVDVMQINRPNDLGDIANLGLTMAEGKLVLAGLQREFVAGQARDHAVVRRPDCQVCGLACRLKDYSGHKIATFCGPRHDAASPILLCHVRRDRGWQRMAIALPIDAGAGSAPGPTLRLDAISGGC
jgi:hypothetical protein